MNDSARLAALRKYAILDTLPEQTYDDLTSLASFISGAPISLISLVDKDRQWFKSSVGLGDRETPRDQSFCAYTIADARTLIVEDTLLDPRFSDNPLVAGEPGIRFYAGAPLVDPHGHVLGTLCLIDNKPREISAAQVSALEALSRQVMQLLEARLGVLESQKAAKALMQSEKLAAVGRLASSMAHEINNPLEAVTNLLYLSRQRATDPDLESWLDQAEQELRRISVIANQTLRFHKQTSKPQSINCHSLFSTILSVYESRIKNAGITIEKRKRATEPVECFEGDIRQVLGNVVSNAIDAMPMGGRLIVRSREGTNWRTGKRGLVLTVADSGMGMSHDTQCRMFEAFFSTKGIGGAGLGLWISADIMHRHGGKITIRSSQESAQTGTVVSLFIPFEGAEELGMSALLEPSFASATR
ncbi:MAG: GAF domain-containing sensor histidine kinase [Edaphobacter sp.]